jgi:hypothetical protein
MEVSRMEGKFARLPDFEEYKGWRIGNAKS